MHITLDNDQEDAILQEVKANVFQLVNKSVEDLNNSKPYLTRQAMSKWLGIAPTTLDGWVKEGLPVATLSNGRKLYGKDTVKEWLKSQEVSTKAQKKTVNEQSKTPLTVL